MGAQLLKEAATKTTISPVMAPPLQQFSPTRSSAKASRTHAGANPMLLKRGIEAASKAAAEALHKQAIDITTKKKSLVATISPRTNRLVN